jgi:hypothetical protein
MECAVAQFPFMTDEHFIATIEEGIAQHVPTEYRPAVEQRLAWLQQLADE